MLEVVSNTKFEKICFRNPTWRRLTGVFQNGFSPKKFVKLVLHHLTSMQCGNTISGNVMNVYVSTPNTVFFIQRKNSVQIFPAPKSVLHH